MCQGWKNKHIGSYLCFINTKHKDPYFCQKGDYCISDLLYGILFCIYIMDETYYMRALELTGLLSEPAIRNAMKSISLKEGSKILDAPCGIGNHIEWMLEEFKNPQITGFDLAEAHIEEAKKRVSKKNADDNCSFVVGDMNQLEFGDNSFDMVWCSDGLWAGPKEMGCISEDPCDILESMVRITKPGGIIAVLFWSTQKILPGYPWLEAQLNATQSAIMSVNPGTAPELHFMCTPAWMRKTGLKNIQSHTFVADLQGPLSPEQKEGVASMFEMLYSQSEQEVSEELWANFKKITNPDDENSLPNNENYAGFLTYTMFTGTNKNSQ